MDMQSCNAFGKYVPWQGKCNEWIFVDWEGQKYQKNDVSLSPNDLG